MAWAVIGGLIAVIVVIVAVLVLRKSKGANAADTAKATGKNMMKRTSRLPAAILDENMYDVRIYSYSSTQMRSLDDVMGARMATYRDQGSIEGYGKPLYEKEQFRPDKTMTDDLGVIIMEAMEVKRVNATRTLYFMMSDALEDLRVVAHPEIVLMREVVAGELRKERNVLISIDRTPAS